MPDLARETLAEMLLTALFVLLGIWIGRSAGPFDWPGAHNGPAPSVEMRIDGSELSRLQELGIVR